MGGRRDVGRTGRSDDVDQRIEVGAEGAVRIAAASQALGYRAIVDVCDKSQHQANAGFGKPGVDGKADRTGAGQQTDQGNEIGRVEDVRDDRLGARP